jgi:hypothetical protein
MPHSPKVFSLRLAAVSLDLHAASTSLPESERHWMDFLTYLDRFANHVLALKAPGLQQPVSEMGRLRNSDALLVYLRHARNSNEHTLREIVEVVLGSVGGCGTSLIGGPGGGTIFRGTIDGGQPATNAEMLNIILRFGVDRLELLDVFDRSGKRYCVPIEHLGCPVDSKVPLEVGRMGLCCYQRLFPDFA